MIKEQKSIYTIKKRKGRYFFINKRNSIPKTYFAYKHLKLLSNHSRRSALRYCKHVRGSYPGIYGIFLKEKGRNRLNLGKCLYIGQSTNIKRRKSEHMECINKAIKELSKGRPHTLSSKYYKIAKNIISGEKIIFVTVFSFDKREWSKLDLDQIRELMCLYEQWAMDTYKPSYNFLASRMTDKNMFYGGGYTRNNS